MESLGFITVNAYGLDLPAGKIGFRGEVKVHASTLAGRLQDLGGLGSILRYGADVGVRHIEGGGEILVEGSLDLEIIREPNQLAVGDRAQVANLFQQAEFLGEVGIAPAACVIVVDLDLFDQKCFRTALDFGRRFDRSHRGTTHFRVNGTRLQVTARIDVVPDPAVVDVPGAI